MAKDPDQLSEKEAAKRRDAALLRALKTPPKANKDFIGRGSKSPKAQKPRINRHQGR